MTQIETFREAVRQLTVAVEEIDQAHATLRDVGLHNYAASKVRNQRRLNLEELYDHAESLLRDLEGSECDACGLLIGQHPVDGCKEWRD